MWPFNALRHLITPNSSLEHRIMSKLDDLSTAIATLTTSTNNYQAAVNAALAAHGNDDAALQTATDNLNALTAQVDAATAAITPVPAP